MALDTVPPRQGRLIVFLGAAAGVGKTYAMLGEARLAVEDGVDLVIGYLEPHGRRATEDRARGLERAPVVEMGPGGRAWTEMDVPWLLARRPSVALVDELAHTYAMGEPPRRRHQDVAELRRHGIEVWTTLNVQHIEGLSERVARITGATVRETVPDQLVHDADEVRLVDLSPAALRERLSRGLVYPREHVEQALSGFFTLPNLAALRALVLHELAEVAAAQYAAISGRRLEGTAERVLVGVTGRAAGEAELVREAARMARRLDGELVVVVAEDGGKRDRPAIRGRLAELESLAEGLGASVLRRQADDPTDVLIREAAGIGATRVVILAPRPGRILPGGGLGPVGRILREVRSADVTLLRTEDEERPTGGGS
jgi:two-component system sensor histidine kinase KdpD